MKKEVIYIYKDSNPIGNFSYHFDFQKLKIPNFSFLLVCLIFGNKVAILLCFQLCSACYTTCSACYTTCSACYTTRSPCYTTCSHGYTTCSPCYTSVETGSGHPGHIFSGSSGSDPVYNLSGSDPDWIT